MTTMEFTEEMATYCYKYAEIKIKQRFGWSIPNEDIEDLKQYVVRKVVIKFNRLYNPQKSTWKTFCVCCLESGLKDAWKYYYRQHQRLQTEPLDDRHEEIEDMRRDMLDIIDELFDDKTLHDVAMLKWQGFNQRQICKKLGISKQDYLNALVRIHDAIRGKTSP